MPADAAPDDDARSPGRDGGAGFDAGPGSCNALGRWQECDTDTVPDCATACRNRGLTCVESCCANLDGSRFELRVGGIYPSTVCAASEVASNSGVGCTYPLPAKGALAMCCCR